ncbi:MAG: DUF1501 domain-containing protein [Nocardioides sp.]
MTDLTGTTTPTPDAAARACGCPEFSLSRRRFLAGVTASTGALAGTQLFGDAFRQVAYGANPDGNVVVVLSFRGGADGVSIVVPTGADDQTRLQALRPDIRIRTSDVATGGNGFGLHPGLAPLVDMWGQGKFGAVHAVGMGEPNRSHFDSMELVEKANPGSSERRGWINRVAGLDAAARPEEQIQLGDSMVPTSLQGPTAALGAYNVNALTLPDLWPDVDLAGGIRKAWGGGNTMLHRGVRTALGAVDRLADLAATDLDPLTSAYPAGPLQDVLANTEALIKADVGAKMVTIDYGDWDMHVGLGQPGSGWMFDHLQHFASSMATFFSRLGTWADKVTVVTISEFGRRLEQNGDAGVDHGYGNVMLLLGGGVQGGQVHVGSGGWPTLAADALVDGDLAVTHDYRSVFWEVLRSSCPAASVPASCRACSRA